MTRTEPGALECAACSAPAADQTEAGAFTVAGEFCVAHTAVCGVLAHLFDGIRSACAPEIEYYACPDCGGRDVQWQSWVEANTGAQKDGAGEGAWCPDCAAAYDAPDRAHTDVGDGHIADVCCIRGEWCTFHSFEPGGPACPGSGPLRSPVELEAEEEADRAKVDEDDERGPRGLR